MAPLKTQKTKAKATKNTTASTKKTGQRPAIKPKTSGKVSPASQGTASRAVSITEEEDDEGSQVGEILDRDGDAVMESAVEEDPEAELSMGPIYSISARLIRSRATGEGLDCTNLCLLQAHTDHRVC
jgi:hypothetical protein